MSIDSVSDEQLLSSVIDEMLGMCGNEGQRTIISRNIDSFYDWGLDALEEEGAFGGFEDMLDALDVSDGDHSLQATIDMWEVGYEGLVGQSSFHDGYDEAGEGTGDEA